MAPHAVMLYADLIAARDRQWVNERLDYNLAPRRLRAQREGCGVPDSQGQRAMNYQDVDKFAHDLLTVLRPLGWDEVFVTHLNGWARWVRSDAPPNGERFVRVCWLATPIAC